MPDVRLNLLVLKSTRLEPLRTFYSLLGIEFAEERHGEGPRHYAGHVGELVLELYPLVEGASEDKTRLGFTVLGLDALVHRLEAAGVEIVGRPRRTAWGYRTVVRDPDGRAIELSEA